MCVNEHEYYSQYIFTETLNVFSHEGGLSTGGSAAIQALYVWLPAWEKAAQILWVSCLLYQVIDLSTHTELHTVLHTLQFLL